MLFFISFTHIDLTVFVVWTLVVFTFFHLLFFNKLSEQSVHSIKKVLLSRLYGILFFGLLPLLFSYLYFQKDVAAIGLVSPINNHLVELYIWCSILAIITFLNARTSENLTQYPQFRTHEWSFLTFFLSALSLILYLISYEFLFRGLLLFVSFEIIGLYGSIVLNVILYALVHIPKGKKETIGSIPFGILLCYLSLKTGSILYAMILHICLALLTEWVTFYYQPMMKFTKKLY